MTGSGQEGKVACRISTYFVEIEAAAILKATEHENRDLEASRGDVQRFDRNLREAAAQYQRALDEAGPNQIRSELRALNSAASLALVKPNHRKFAKVRELARALSQETKTLLEHRLAEREAQGGSGRLLDDVASCADGEAVCQQLVSLSQIGRCLKKGRRRPGGKQSRATSIPTLYAPPAKENPSWREPERELEIILALSWLELTSSSPSADEAYRSFVENVFEQLLIKGVDIAQLTKDGRAKSQAFANLSGGASAQPLKICD